MTDSNTAISGYDSAYFEAQAQRLQATAACVDAAPAGELSLVLDEQETVASGQAGDLLKYASKGKYSEALQEMASETDLKWLTAFGDHASPYKADDQAQTLQPVCRAAVTTMLDFMDVEMLVQLLHHKPAQGSIAAPLQEKTVLQLCSQALGQDYAGAPSIYVGNWSKQSTPSGPGHALHAWQLQRIDPEQRWILYRVSLQLHYTPAGQLDRATIYQHPAAGKYQHHQEYLATLAWDADGYHAVHLSLESDEYDGEGYLRSVKFWKG